MRLCILFACIFTLFASSLNGTTVDMFCEQLDKGFTTNLLDLEKMGKTVLKKRSLTTKDKVKVSTRLASLYVYMGKFEEAKKYATIARTLAKDSSLLKLLASSLSVLSSSYLGLAKQEKDSDQSQFFFEQAKEIGEEALALAREIKDHNFLLSRVLSNLGTVYTESPYEDSSIAIDLYKEAISFLKEEDIETFKNLIRLAQVELQMQKMKTAWETLTPLFLLKLEEGMRAFLYATASEIALQEERPIQSSILASNALRIFKKLHYKANIESLEATIKKIDKMLEKNPQPSFLCE